MKRVHSTHPEDNMIDFQGRKRMTPTIALADIIKIRAEKTLSAEQIELLDALENQLLKILNSYSKTNVSE